MSIVRYKFRLPEIFCVPFWEKFQEISCIWKWHRGVHTSVYDGIPCTSLSRWLLQSCMVRIQVMKSMAVLLLVWKFYYPQLITCIYPFSRLSQLFPFLFFTTFFLISFSSLIRLLCPRILLTTLLPNWGLLCIRTQVSVPRKNFLRPRKLLCIRRSILYLESQIRTL